MADEGKIVEKAWGAEFWITNEPEYCAKFLRVEAGQQCSLHLHTEKSESFICLEGTGWCERGEVVLSLRPGVVVRVDAGIAHRFAAIGEAMLLLEVSTHHDDQDVSRMTVSGTQAKSPSFERAALDAFLREFNNFF